MEQNGVVPLQLREMHPDFRQFKPGIAIMHAILDTREHLALEMLYRCDGSPPEAQDAYSLESLTLQSDVDMERDQDLDAVSHIANSDASRIEYSPESSCTEITTGAADDAHGSDGFNHMTSVSSIDFLVHVGSQFIHFPLESSTLSREGGEVASVGHEEDMNLGADRKETTNETESTKQRVSANYLVVMVMYNKIDVG
jgi:hypothetical protein